MLVEYCGDIFFVELDICKFEYIGNLVWIDCQIVGRRGFSLAFQIAFQKRFVADLAYVKVDDEVMLVFACLGGCHSFTDVVHSFDRLGR